MDTNNIFITAEIGINHNGDLEIAKKLINMAVRCGCDAVKFQKRVVEKAYPKELLDSPHDSPWGTTQRDEKLGRELSKSDYDVIDYYCKEKNIPWFASAWDIESQEFLKQYNLKFNKVASKMITNIPLLMLIAREYKPTFISTGTDNWADIEKAVDIFDNAGCQYTLMHCVPKYPCPDNECDLHRIEELNYRFGGDKGYSSHNSGILDTSLAVMLGAVVLEKHITLDRTLYGKDQSASVEERGLQLLVRDARRVWEML